jgi:hypothetical protein
MASAAEARIREKAERLLRELFPDARIVHEFDLGGVRLDLAAITPDRLALVEIKSENDTLSRLARQVEFAHRLGGPVFVCFAPKWREAIREAGLWNTQRLEETDTGFDGLMPYWLAHPDRYDSRGLMGLLLKPELFALAKPFGAKSRMDVPSLHHLVHENMTGREIRRSTFAALRARRFGWTCDDPLAANDSAALPKETAA